MQDSNLMTQYADPELISALDIGDKLIGALLTTLLGMGITIMVLIIIWAAIACMTKILNREPAKSNKKLIPEGIEIVSDEEEDEEELIAVMMAAYALATENKKAYSSLKLKRIERVRR